MTWTIRNGFLMDENENIIATIMVGTPLRIEKIIEAAPDLLETTNSFIEDVDSGKLKPKSSVDKFKSVLFKHDLTQ